MTGRNQKDQQPGLIRRAMKCSLFVFVICVAVVLPTVLVQPGVQDVQAEVSSVTNDPVGDLVVFSQDYASTGTVPGNICLAMDSMSGSVTNLNLSYNAASHCVSLDAAAGAVGKLFVGGLSPSLSTTITIDMGMGRTEDHATANVYAGGAWLAVRISNNTPTDDLIITSNYYTYTNPTLHSATSVTPNVGFNDDGRFEITIVSDCASRTNTIYLNGVEKLTTPYTRYLPYSLTTVYDPFVNPFVHFSFASIYSGQTAYLQLYSIEQTVPEYSYVTPISNPKLTSFGVDGPHPWDTVDDGLSLLDQGTIWADVKSIARYSPSDLAALQALIADGWELGIHYSARLYDLPLTDAIALMDAETAEITAIFGEPPTSFCSLQGADNITHAEYAYTNFGMVSRAGVNGCGAGLSSIANLGDNCWTFWSIASAAGIVIPTFSHELDVAPAIAWSISPDNFSSYVSNYENRGVQIIGFREYWEKAQNSYHTVISNVVSDPGVSLSFTVANIGGKSRLLVNAPWADVVQDGSGGDVPYEVYGAGILLEVEAGDYTVAAAPQAGVAWGSHDTPTAMNAGQTYNVSLNITNTTNSTWFADGPNPIHLAYHWYTSDGYLVVWDGQRSLLSADVGPGESTSVSGSVIAPDSPGSYILNWDLVQEWVTWFGMAGCPTMDIPVEVTAEYGVTWGSHDTPSVMDAGQAYNVSISFTNTSNFTWPPGGPNPVHLAYHWYTSEGYLVVWDGQRSLLPADVGPGGSTTVSAVVTAPNSAGSYILRWDLVQEDVTWFGMAGCRTTDVGVEITA